MCWMEFLKFMSAHGSNHKKSTRKQYKPFRPDYSILNIIIVMSESTPLNSEESESTKLSMLDEFYTDFADRVTNYAKDTFIGGVICYNRAKIQASVALRNARLEYFVLDSFISVVESVFGLLGWIWTYFTHKRLEPSSPEWICVAKYNVVDDSLCTIDNYQKIGIVDDDYPEVFDYGFKLMCKRHSNVHYNGIIIGSFSQHKTVVRLLGKVIPEVDFNKLSVSPVDFLSLEFRCRNYPAVYIQVPKSHYLVGNQILSKEYILRYFEHLPIYCEWHYDESYQLSGLDDELNNFVLDSTQFIELKEYGYVIRSMDELKPATETKE